MSPIKIYLQTDLCKWKDMVHGIVAGTKLKIKFCLGLIKHDAPKLHVEWA